MKKTGLFILLLVLVMCNILHAQENNPYNSNFETLTGKTLYQLTNSYILKYKFEEKLIVDKEISSLSQKIKKSNDETIKADWLFLKAMIEISKKETFNYKKTLNNYLLFSENNLTDYPYKAKLKIVEGFYNFYNGTWTNSLTSFKDGALQAEAEGDKICELICKKQIAYITAFSIDYKKGVRDLKKLYQALKNTNYPHKIKKDISILKLKTAELIARFELITRVYNLNKTSKIDSILKYNKLYEEDVKKSNEKLEYSRMYMTNAQTSINIGNFKVAQKYIDSAKPLDKSFFNDFILAQILYHNKEYQKVIKLLEFFDKAENVDKKTYPWLDYSFKYLAKAYQKTGNYKKSNYYYKHYVNSSINFNKIIDSVSQKIRKDEIINFKKELAQLQTKKNTKKNQIFRVNTIIISLFLFLFIITCFYWIKKKTKNKSVDLENEIDKKELIIKKEIVNKIIKGLRKLEESKYFLKTECSAYNTAKKIKTNTSYLSRVIKSHHKKTFNEYINDLRIKYVIKRLENDKRFRSFSIQSITEELGYKSADSFTKYFKQHTGILPSKYIKRLNESKLNSIKNNPF